MLVDNFIQFSVEDTGKGIAKELHAKVFERFHQGDNILSDVPKGTGLGLTISKSLIELMHGSIWVESEIGVGTTFYFKIPNVHTAKHAKAILPKEDETLTFSNLKILVAEDIDYNYLLLTEYLEETNATIMRAINGIEAVDICASNLDIDLVLMDIRMPLMDGYDATRKIKAMRPNLPVIAQTAYAFDEKKEAFNAGCDNIISKPIIKEILLEMIKKTTHKTN